jgi:hypothetical protein
MRRLLSIPVSILLALNPVWSGVAAAQSPTPTTPIQHVAVIFDENNSFDHYFGTYPKATNPPGQPRFTALPNTPTVNGFSPGLLTSNPPGGPNLAALEQELWAKSLPEAEPRLRLPGTSISPNLPASRTARGN